jgi:hypothetical protein
MLFIPKSLPRHGHISQIAALLDFDTQLFFLLGSRNKKLLIVLSAEPSSIAGLLADTAISMTMTSCC